jgi:magnesium chelatase subunit D
MLKQATRKPVEIRVISTWEDDDLLWGTPGLQAGDTAWTAHWNHGLLEPPQGALLLIVIPDLARISLPAARAAIALIEADTAQAARNGGDHKWQSNCCWLAACDSSERGKVSPHLLDRFALRLVHASPQGEYIARRLTQSANRRQAVNGRALPSVGRLSPVWRQRIDRALLEPSPALPPGLVTYALNRRAAGQGLRADLALVRAAQALARLRGDDAVTRAHVDAAAAWGKFSPAPAVTPAPAVDSGSHSGADSSDQSGDAERDDGDHSAHAAAVYAAREQAAQAGGAIAAPAPAEGVTPEPAVEALQLQPPPRRSLNRGRGSGAIIGVRATRTLDDLSAYHTVLEAIKARNLRLKEWHDVHGETRTDLMLMPTDLRAYRRAPVVDKLLLLVIDFTSVRNTVWQDLLRRHYLWPAYVERKQIGLVRVGAKESPSHLQAESLIARSLLDLRLFAWFNSSPGTATPLAHGLLLAYQHLEAALMRKWQPLKTVNLVIFTDGRGNIPLEASRSGTEPAAPVGLQGYEDALKVARDIRGLHWVETTLFCPPAPYYSNLVSGLADALGAPLRRIEAPAPAFEEGVS